MAPSVALKTNYACKPIDGATVTIPQRLFLKLIFFGAWETGKVIIHTVSAGGGCL